MLDLYFWPENNVLYSVMYILIWVHSCHSSAFLGLPIINLWLGWQCLRRLCETRRVSFFFLDVIFNPISHIVSCSLINMFELWLLGNFSDDFDWAWFCSANSEFLASFFLFFVQIFGFLLFVYEENEVESLLVNIWRKILHLEDVIVFCHLS